MGQHLPGRRGRRRLAPLLVLVQVARLDPHPRQAGRAAEVPRGDGRRARAASAPRASASRCESATWDDARHVWTVTLDDGTTDECHVFISGVGFLNVPRYPDWPGLDDFTGPKFHTSRWEHEHDLTGKVVAVVGTGSTASQLVPAIQPDVQHLYLFQREPGLGDAQGRPRLHRRGAQAVLEPVAPPAGAPPAEVAAREEHLGRQGLRGRHQAERGAHAVLPRLHRQDLRGPPRPAGGGHAAATRTRASGRSSPSTFYPALKEPNVELVPQGGGVGDADRASSTSTASSARSTSS